MVIDVFDMVAGIMAGNILYDFAKTQWRKRHPSKRFTEALRSAFIVGAGTRQLLQHNPDHSGWVEVEGVRLDIALAAPPEKEEVKHEV